MDWLKPVSPGSHGDYIVGPESDQWRISKIDAAEAGEQTEEQKTEAIFDALRVRFAKAWWDGYHAGVQDTQFVDEAPTPNPWERP